eukprot:1394680-Amorphochlora_amoeboformis.AAC.2
MGSLAHQVLLQIYINVLLIAALPWNGPAGLGYAILWLSYYALPQIESKGAYWLVASGFTSGVCLMNAIGAYLVTQSDRSQEKWLEILGLEGLGMLKVVPEVMEIFRLV